MQGLVFLILFVWFLALLGGGHRSTGGGIHLALLAALAVYAIDGL